MKERVFDVRAGEKQRHFGIRELVGHIGQCAVRVNASEVGCQPTGILAVIVLLAVLMAVIALMP